MGGERESVTEQKVETKTGETQVVGSVRYHESKGQVHFHDDANGLKVEIPVASWYKAWMNLLSSLPGEFHYADVNLKTILHIKIVVKKANPKKSRPAPQIDALMHIERIETSFSFDKLNTFSIK